MLLAVTHHRIFIIFNQDILKTNPNQSGILILRKLLALSYPTFQTKII